MSFFWKVFSASVAVLAVTALVVSLLVIRTARDDLRGQIEARVHDLAPVVAAVAQRELSRPADPSRLDGAFAALAADVSDYRITIIRNDGVVLWDSDEDPAVMDNHGARPEVLNPGEVVHRFSDTLGEPLTYCAWRIRDGEAELGTARVALSEAGVEAQIAELKGAIRTGVLLGVLCGLLIAFFSSRRLAQPLTEMVRAVVEIGKARSFRSLPEGRNDEIGMLARAINRMSAELGSRSEQMGREEQQKAAILSGMSEGLLAVGRSQEVVLINDAAHSLLDLEADDVLGRPVWEASRAPEVVHSVEECLATGHRLVDEFQLEKDGEEQVIRLATAPFHDENGDVDGCVLVISDLTELRRLEKVRRDFVANVSHELKTPLTSMRGYVEAVAEDEEMEADIRRNFLDKALINTERLSAIVSDLLSLARIESEDGALRSETIDLEDLARDCIRNVASAAERKLIQVDLEPVELGLQVEGDRDALALAFGNLVDNAVKYSPEESRVEVQVFREGPWFHLQVSDQGPGIPRGEQERIFERFYRVDKDRSRRLGGTGLGLAIVKNVALSHGGTASVQSEVGQGSRFRISLPSDVVQATRAD